MTEKEKAEAYDKAIERAKKLYDNGITEEIFPELKEDDDERIKKELIQWVDEFPDIIWRGHYKKDIIAWLEKQGKQKRQVHFPKFTFDDILALQCCMVTVKNVQEDNELYEQLNLIHNKMYDAYRLGKQGETSPILSNSLNTGKNEQKTADKVEPKFKVGDWIISSVLGTARIIGVNDSNEFQLEYTDGKQEFSSIDYVNYAYDKWTIENGKDGDVLSFYSEYKGNKMVQVGIIEKYVGKHGGCSNTFKIHVGVNWDNNLQIGRYMGCSDIYPATKEQRDLLSQKIKDAGYKWNDETKALEKLEDFGKVGKSSFHEGDWVVYNNDVCQIVKREEGCNKLVTVFGIEKELVNERNLSTARLWTIQDGKDGDILFTSSSASSDTFVFKNIDEKGNAECYFAYDSEDGFTEGKYHFIGSASDCKPATKEQRDLLFQKIKETGYEWDVDKKELKKLDLVPNKKPILEGLKMKTYNDINIGDTVYIWGTSDSSVDETTITEKYDDRGHWNLKFSNGCVGRALKNGTSSTMGMYACLVYSDKEAVRESINEQIKILSNIKI